MVHTFSKRIISSEAAHQIRRASEARAADDGGARKAFSRMDAAPLGA
jgi:hypothetical protein